MIFTVAAILAPCAAAALPERFEARRAHVLCLFWLVLSLQFLAGAQRPHASAQFLLQLPGQLIWGATGWTGTGLLCAALCLPARDWSRRELAGLSGAAMMLASQSPLAYLASIAASAPLLGRRTWAVLPLGAGLALTIALPGALGEWAGWLAVWPGLALLCSLPPFSAGKGLLPEPCRNRPVIASAGLLGGLPVLASAMPEGLATGAQFLVALALVQAFLSALSYTKGNRDAAAGWIIGTAMAGFCTLGSAGWDGAAVLLACLPLLDTLQSRGRDWLATAAPGMPTCVGVLLVALGAWTSPWMAGPAWSIAIGATWGLMLTRTATGRTSWGDALLVLAGLVPALLLQPVQETSTGRLNELSPVLHALRAGELPGWL